MSRRLTAIDLFCGAGGLAQGAQLAGFKAVGALDHWGPAVQTFEANHPGTKCINADVTEVVTKDLLSEFEVSSVDLVAGGPPCQGFSTSGKRAWDDPRNLLVKEYWRIVSELRPRAFLFENVEGFASFADGQLIEELEAEASQEYSCRYLVVPAVRYGVPQRRRRFMFVGVRKGLEFRFPDFTHGPDPSMLDEEASWITFDEATSDLPAIEAGQEATSYGSPPLNDYQAERRAAGGGLTEHIAPQHGQKMVDLVSYIPPGRSAYEVWDSIPPSLRPGKGFPNSYARIKGDEPGPTMTRNFTVPSSANCIHPRANRGLSLREGARIQSFDDDYRFVGTYSDKRLLIGNAVPPLLAKAVCTEIMRGLTSGRTHSQSEAGTSGNRA